MVELPAWLWRPLLETVILPFRPKKSAALYQKIWHEEGAPLVVFTRRLSEKLSSHFPDTEVRYAMRYGHPSIAEVIEPWKNTLDRLIVLPLFPQSAAATTASVFDALGSAFRHWRRIPDVVFRSEYCDHPAYIEACAQQIETHWETHGKQPLLLLSFHGIPMRCVELGDAYQAQCYRTAQALQKRLGLSDDTMMTVFQSRFGRLPWLQPYCDETLEKLPHEGKKAIDIFCPGFR